MNEITNVSRVKGVFSLRYSVAGISHVDHYYCGAINMWRDVFSTKHSNLLRGLEPGHSVTLEEEGVLFPVDKAKIFCLRKDQWQPPKGLPWFLEPRIGRWYPQGYLKGIAGVFPQTAAPFRIVGIESNAMHIDCNHPLAGRELTIDFHADEVSATTHERGGRYTDWLAEATDGGPGMQVLPDCGYIDFRETDATHRRMEGDDAVFYRLPRLVNHIDSTARRHLLISTDSILQENMRVLDLMSSIQSHLGKSLIVTGLGMNLEELSKNPTLTEWLVHDLNKDPQLPFADEHFDAVCCHLSFEYLIDPYRVVAECARVLRNEGVILMSFSNRWFPEKVTRVWQMLHEFERVGYVVQNVKRKFTRIVTRSYRNWPRPEDDDHYFKIQISDPVYVISAVKA